MLAHECRGSEQSRLFTVGEERDYVVLERFLACSECAQRLEQRTDTGAVVCRRRTGADAVIVHHQEHGLACLLSRQQRDDVLHASRLRISGADARRHLQLWREPERRQLAHDVVAHPIVIGHTHRMRAYRDLVHVAHRAFGRKDIVRRARGNRGRRSGDTEHREDAKNDQRGGTAEAREHG